LQLFSFGGYGLALAVLALVVFGAIECPLAILVTTSNHFLERNFAPIIVDGCNTNKYDCLNVKA